MVIPSKSRFPGISCGAACLLLFSYSHGDTSRIGQGRPNIVMIMVDDLGYGDLSSQGAPDLRTPKMDSLINSGMRFDRFHANSTVCSPTRASLLTGRYPDLAGVPGVIRTMPAENFGFLNPGLPTLPDALKKAGYQSALIGKWHLGLESPNLPRQRGFDYFHGFLGDMMDDYYSHTREGFNYMRENETMVAPTGHATDVFTQWALDYIAAPRKSPGPFFLYLAYNAPHHPLQPPKAWLDRVKLREPGIADGRANLVALIEHLDDGIGRVLAGLRAAGLDGNTLVVVTSDNGGLLSDGARNLPWSGGKGDMLEGGLCVPMGAAWKGRIPAASRSDRLALTMDLFPTFCEAAGAECNHEMDGRSFLPTLLGLSQAEENRTLIWTRRGDRDSLDRPYYAARKGPDKILQNQPDEPMRRFDLAADPRENTRLGQAGTVFQALTDALRSHLSMADAVGWKPGSPLVIARTLKIISPQGGEAWAPGSRQTLRWRSQGDIASVKLEWLAGTGSWNTIAGSVPDRDSVNVFAWTLPETPGGDLKVRVSALGGNVSDTCDARVGIPANLGMPIPRRRGSRRNAILVGPSRFDMPNGGGTPDVFDTRGVLLRSLNPAP